MKIIVKKIGNLLLLVSLLTFIASCGDGSDDKKTENDKGDGVAKEEVETVAKELPVVCLWSGLSVRETPSAKGKYITTLYLGEEATTLGEKEKDETNPKKPVSYVKVRLADGKEGWMSEKFIAVNGVSHALVGISKLYKRPDILAAGKSEFDRLQYVVVLEEKDDWARVKGIDRATKWFKTGWVKKDKLTNEKIDVTVAILFARALGKKGTEKQVEALQDIVDNVDLNSSEFIPNVKSKIESLNMPSGDDL